VPAQLFTRCERTRLVCVRATHSPVGLTVPQWFSRRRRFTREKEKSRLFQNAPNAARAEVLSKSVLAHVAERFNGVGTAQLKSVGYHNLLQLCLGARVS